MRNYREILKFVTPKSKQLDFVLLFAQSMTSLKKDFAKLANNLVPSGMLWVAWPKKASGVTTDLTENEVRRIGLDAGLVDVKICAINDVWSGLKFVYRLRDRGPARVTPSLDQSFPQPGCE